MSMIDDARSEAATVLALTPEELAALSVHDVLHRYWASRSGLPLDSNSMQDHVREVSAIYHYIRDVGAV